MSKLPTNWVETSLGKLSEYITSGSRDWSKYYSNEGALFIRTQDINKNKLCKQEFIARVALPGTVEGKRTLVRDADILITITGANVGKCALVKEALPEAYVSQSVALVRLVEKSLAPFLHKQLLAPNSANLQTWLEENAYGLGRPVLSLENVRSVPVKLPPLSEQKRIADKLDAVLAKVDACGDRLDRIPVILKRFRQSILTAATSGVLTEDWRAAKELRTPDSAVLGEYCYVLGGKRLPKGFELTDQNTGFPYVRVTDFATFSVKTEQLKYVPIEAVTTIKKYIINSGDIYISIAGSIGLVGQIPETISGSNLTENAARIIVRDGFLSRYLMYQLASPELQAQMHAKKIATTQDKLGLFRIKELELIKPSIEEQTEIVRRVESLFAYADRLEARYNSARAQVEKLTPSLLAKAFRGELVPQDPNDEPAAVLLKRIEEQTVTKLPNKRNATTRRKPNTDIPKSLNSLAKSDNYIVKSQSITKLEDISSNHLANILNTFKQQDAKTVWKASGLSIDDFYVQLSREISAGLLRVNEQDESLLELVNSDV